MRNIPKYSLLTQPEVTYDYSVPWVKVSSCNIAFEKRYFSGWTGKTLKRRIVTGSLSNIEDIYFDYRGYDGGALGILGERMVKLPTVIIESYGLFQRDDSGVKSGYQFIYFTFDAAANADAVMRNIRLYALLCGNGQQIFHTRDLR